MIRFLPLLTDGATSPAIDATPQGRVAGTTTVMDRGLPQPACLPTDAHVSEAFSGKTALAWVLGHLRRTGRLKDKMAGVVIPPWLGSWIPMTIHKFAFPQLHPNDATGAVLAYHQWGFPQRIDEVRKECTTHGWYLIEDCAHALWTWHDGHRLGTFGDAAIFSLAKFLPCIAGGALVTQDPALHAFAQQQAGAAQHDLAKEALRVRARYDEHPGPQTSQQLDMQYAIYDQLGGMTPHQRDLAINAIDVGALERRREIWRTISEALPEATHVAGVEPRDVIPWVAPVFAPQEQAHKLATSLKAAGFESGVYRFDQNRNVLSPDLVTAVPLPCHQHLTDEDVNRLIKTTQGALPNVFA